VWISGGDILSPDGSTAVGYLNSPETERALQFLIDLRTKHYVAPHRDVMSEQRTNPGITWGMFYSGRIAMLVSGHWELLKLKQYMERGEMDVGVVPMPSPNDGQRVTVIYAAGWSVPKGTRHPDWAVKLAAFLAGEKAAQIRARSGIAVPARKKIAQELAAADPFGLEKIFVEEIPYGREPWGAKIDEFSRVEDLVEDAVDDVLIGSRDIHEVFTQAAYRIDDELKNLAIPRKDAVALKGNPEILRFLLLVLGVALVAATAGTLLTRRGDRASILKGYSFIAPSFVILIVFVFAPVFFSLYLSFHQWNVVSSDKPFVGFENIQSLLAERDFWNAMKNTVVYSLHVPLGMAVSLAVAMMMNQKMRGVNLLRTLFFLPSVSSFVAIALVWQWMYHPQFGLANYLLGFFGIPPFSWLSEPSTALASIMLMSIWMGIGYQMVIFLAGLQGISHELYEAAITDGANVWQRFWKITLPLLKPTTFFILVTSMIGSFQVFAFVYVMTEGGPLHSTDVVVYHIYKNAWEYLKMGYASAMSWVLFLIIMVATWVQFRLIGKRVEYG
jgi:multiple sugar transport system permease protein